MPDKKPCCRCKIIKNIEDFGVVRANKNGRRGICKACHKELRSMPEDKEKRRLRELNPDFQRKKKEYNGGYRKRIDIKQKNKEYAKEYNQRPDVIEKRKEYYQRPEVKKRQKEYMKRPEVKKYMREYQRRPEIRNHLKEYQKRPEVKARQRESMRKYTNNPGYKQKRREYNQRPEVKQRKKEYEDTPEWRAAHVKACSKRRAKIKGLEYSLTYEQWCKIIELQRNKCVICGKAFTKKNPATRDHIIPAARAGPFTMENTQAVHKDCNSKKKDKIDKSNIVSWISRPDLCVDEVPY